MDLYPVRHRRCGRVILYFVRHLHVGDVVTAQNVRLLDGKTPLPDTALRCPWCGLISPTELQQSDTTESVEFAE